MKKLLLQLDSDELASSFDTITAYDAGVDHVIYYSGVRVESVRNIVYGAMFTRGGEELKNSAVFIGGSSVPTGEEMLKAAQDAFFGPVRVSVMADPNGSNTTAAAAVLKIVRAVPVAGKCAVIFAGTGPVGVRACGLIGQRRLSGNPYLPEDGSRRKREPIHPGAFWFNRYPYGSPR